MTDPKAGTSVLATLTASVMAAKKAATTRALTAVEGERPPRIPDVPGDFLTDEGLGNVADDLRRNAEYLVKVADGIDVMRGKPPGSIVAALAPVMSIDAQRLERERAADKRAAEMKAAEMKAAPPTAFDAHIGQLQAEAQAAVFTSDIAIEPLRRHGFQRSPLPGAPEQLCLCGKREPHAIHHNPVWPWACPTHGRVILKTSSRTGRTFNGCPDCGLFERT